MVVHCVFCCYVEFPGRTILVALEVLRSRDAAQEFVMTVVCVSSMILLIWVSLFILRVFLGHEIAILVRSMCGSPIHRSSRSRLFMIIGKNVGYKV